MRKKKKSEYMSLAGHLREMRNRILVCLILFTAAVAGSLAYAKELVTFLLSMGRDYGYRFVYIAPQELLMQYFAVSLIAGVCVTLPMLFYQVWAFLRPGLKKSENLFFVLAMVFGFLCFGAGAYFAYRIMLPFMLSFLQSLSAGSGVSASVSVQNYIAFLMTVFMVFGAVFELPVVSVLLTQLGFLKIEWMKKGRKVMIVMIFFVAAVITPPDVVSQILVAVPMVILYELSILLCSICQRLKGGRQKRGDTEEKKSSCGDAAES